MGMNDQEALALMIDQGFQEREEATAKLQRAKLSSANSRRTLSAIAIGSACGTESSVRKAPGMH